MNYFAHGIRFLDRPYFLAGTSIPDWLSVADRKVRMRSIRVAPFADDSSSRQSEIAAGVLQHLEDDRWFHQTRAFFEITGEMTILFRDVLGREDGFRPGFLGHIVTELLLDGVLIENQPHLLDRYYEALNEIDAGVVQDTVNQMAQYQTQNLKPLLPRFNAEQFLRDYTDSSRLLFRLNQVMRRIKLNQLPAEIEDVLKAGWDVVRPRAADLLPPEHFQIPDTMTLKL